MLACAGPEQAAPTTTSPDGTDESFETAYLRAGAVKVRYVEVPTGYSLTDMNPRGDLLLGSTWLPKGKKEPETLPFVGQFINNGRQIVGFTGGVFLKGEAIDIGTPCVPVSFWICLQPPPTLAQSENGDILVTYRRDAPTTGRDPNRGLAVWRASSATWQELEYIAFANGTSFAPAAISDGGWVVARVMLSVPFDSWFGRVYPPTAAHYDLALSGACPAPNTTALDVYPRDINDLGDVVGAVVRRTGSGIETLGAKWSGDGTPTLLDGIPTTIDNLGNMAGVRAGRAVAWPASGMVIDLSAAAPGNARVRKFLKDGQVIGFAAGQAIVWRFGFYQGGSCDYDLG